jgi:aryl-alcohol dehydrogenase-like predicted oxidoreductase
VESLPELLNHESTIMKYRLLGKSALRVSEAALGTMTFGDEGHRDSVARNVGQFRDSRKFRFRMLAVLMI